MASTYTDNLNLEKQEAGDNVDTWGDPHLNNNVIAPLDSTLGATTTVAMSSANVTMTLAQWQCTCIKITGTLTANLVLYFPLSPNASGGTPGVGGRRIVDNQTSGSYTITVKTAATGSTGVVVPQGYRSEVYSDTVNVWFAQNSVPQAVVQNGVESLTIGTSQNDYVIAATTAYARLNVTSAANLTGIANGVAGRLLTLHNVGSATLTIIPSSTSSTAANRFSFPYPVLLTPGQSFSVQYDGTTATWRPSGALPSLGRAGAYKNLLIKNNTTTPNSILDVTADVVTVSDTSNNTFVLNSISVSPNISTSGVNGLDTGSVAANTWYYIWVVFNPSAAASATNPGVVFSVSSTSPTMPSGYTYKMRIGAQRTDASSLFYRVKQVNNQASYVVTSSTNTAALPLLAYGAAGSVTTPTWVAINCSTYTPSTATHVHFFSRALSGYNILAPNNSYGAYNWTTNPAPIVHAATSSLYGTFQLETTNVYWASQNVLSRVFCYGWEDNI